MLVDYQISIDISKKLKIDIKIYQNKQFDKHFK